MLGAAEIIIFKRHWLFSLLRYLFFIIDWLVYSVFSLSYSIFIILSGKTVFSQEVIKSFGAIVIKVHG